MELELNRENQVGREEHTEKTRTEGGGARSASACVIQLAETESTKDLQRKRIRSYLRGECSRTYWR
jgi:hypothetical protein